jgi:hypothetical protein
MSGFDSLFSLASTIGDTASKLQPLLSTFKLGSDLVTSYSKYSGQKKQNEKMRSAIDDAAEQNRLALAERGTQQQAQIKEGMSARARQAMVEKARLAAVANSAGGGNSADRLAQMTDFNLGSDIAMMEANSGSLDRQMVREMGRIDSQSQSQKNQLIDPSVFSILGDLGAAGMGFAQRSRYANPKNPDLSLVNMGSGLTGFDPLSEFGLRPNRPPGQGFKYQ